MQVNFRIAQWVLGGIAAVFVIGLAYFANDYHETKNENEWLQEQVVLSQMVAEPPVVMMPAFNTNPDMVYGDTDVRDILWQVLDRLNAIESSQQPISGYTSTSSDPRGSDNAFQFHIGPNGGGFVIVPR